MSGSIAASGRDRGAERVLRGGGGGAGLGAPVAAEGTGQRRAALPRAAALELLANPGRLLSLTQVGVTLASLGLGWAGEQTRLSSCFLSMFGPLITPRRLRSYLHGASFALGFLAISLFHVVVGEVVPKNLAIEKADRLALLVAPPLLLFYRIAEPFVFVVERCRAGALARAGTGADAAEAAIPPKS